MEDKNKETKTYKVTLFTIDGNNIYPLYKKTITRVSYFRFGADTHYPEPTTDTRVFFYDVNDKMIFTISCYKPDLLEIEEVKD